MKTPTELELQHIAGFYDPAKAHEYYEKHKKLKGRRAGQAAEQTTLARARASSSDPRKGKTKKEIHQNARAKQRMELTVQIQGMERRLGKLEALIKKREHAEASEDRKGKAKKERAAKESTKPKTAAEKAEAARDSKKNRDKHQQREKSRDKKDDGKSGGGSSKKKADGKSKKHTVAELKTLATKVKGKIAVAKQKLAAL